MTDLTAKDIIALKRRARDIADLKRAMKNLARKPQLSSSSIENGAVDLKDDSGTLRGQIGQQWDGTYTTSSMNGPVPPIPVGFSVTGHAGFLNVTWYGQFQSEDTGDIVVAPEDWLRAGVHVGATQDFVPQLGPGSTTRMASIESAAGASGAILLDPGDYWVKLVSITQSGVVSDPSDGVEATVVAATSSDDLAALQSAQNDLLSAVSTNSDAIQSTNVDVASNYDEFTSFQTDTNTTLTTLQPAFDVLNALGTTGVDEDYFWVGDDPAMSTVKLVQVSTFVQAALGAGDGVSFGASMGLVNSAAAGDVEMNNTTPPMTTFYEAFTAAGLAAMPWNS